MLTVPFTFPNTSTLPSQKSDFPQCNNIIEKSFLSAKPTALDYWESSDDKDDCGIIVGCEDGTLYVFTRAGLAVSQADPGEQRRRRPRSPFGLIPRGATSPSSPASATFPLPFSRPTAVSAVTAEMVEAPRNYVDFEDEPDKLKDILQGKNPKERQAFSDTASLSATSRASSISESPSSSKRKSPPRSLLSAGNLAPPTPRSFSSPGSPKDQPSRWTPSFILRYHIIPDCAGPGHAVRSVQVLEGHKYIAVLHQPGDLSIYSSKGGECVATVTIAQNFGDQMSREVWNWCSLKFGIVDEDTLVFVTASTDSSTSAATPDTGEASNEKSHTVFFKLAIGPGDVQLERVGRYDSDGPARGVGIWQMSDDSSAIFSVDTRGHLILREMQMRQSTPEQSTTMSNSPEPDSIGHLALTKSLKAIVIRSSDQLDTTPSPQLNDPTLNLQDAYDAGPLLSDSTLIGLSTRNNNGLLYGIVWAHREMAIFSYSPSKLTILCHSSVSHLEEVEWLDNETYALSFNDRMEVYKLRAVDADNNGILFRNQGESVCYHADLIHVLPTGAHEAATFIPSSDLIVTKTDTEGFRTLVSFCVRSTDGGSNELSTVLWQPMHKIGRLESDIMQTATLPVELEFMIQGYSDGRLRQFSLEQMILANAQLSPTAASKTSQPPLNGSLLGLTVIQNSRTRERYIVGGGDDGSIAFWSLSTLDLCARWIALCAPLIRVIDFEHESVGFLHGCILCIASDGTIAVIVVDGFQFLYLIPGSFSPLERLCVNGNSLLLIYSSGLARVWDVQAKEFHRSMSSDRAEEMLKEYGWVIVPLKPISVHSRLEWRPVAPHLTGKDAAATLVFFLERFVGDAIALTKTISTSKYEVRNILRTFDRLRLLLSALVTPGLSVDVDSICTGKLGLPSAAVDVGLSSEGTTTLYASAGPQDIWSISGNLSASRMLAIVHVLRALSLFEDSLEAANTVIAFYTTSLTSCIGPKYSPPSLEWLGRLWLVGSSDLRQSIRTVFEATLAGLSDQEVIGIAEKWQQYVPSLQPDDERESVRTALALFICGFIAAERFNLLSVGALTNVSKSVAVYFHDDQSTHRVLAIELCSKGFSVWQQYVDTLEILRSLFMLATTARKAAISIQNVGAQARLAVLSIAAQNTALFMSTLCLDVLDPSSLEHRRSVLQILAFLIRKRPLILQPHLPRLMEAVVKSLDPNSNANREAVLGTATEIIGYVVKTYPAIDFHMGSQRLAVGTNEGAVIMYDLKTAIRLYVLEGHRLPLTACSFSPDGRRLVTVSLPDHHVLVWKVGTGFTSFFTPGLPPRQGHGGSQPFKTFPFNFGNEGDTAVDDSLTAVSFEWTGDRNVKVKIQENVLTFST